jgi:hypothetical protein
MPLDYFAPGVYVEEVDRGNRPIEGINLSVPGFIGFTEDVRGDAETFKPMLITTWDQYLESFGKPGSDGFTDFGAYLPFAVQGWFLNGGGRCWVTSLGSRLPGAEPPEAKETATKLITSSGVTSLLFNVKGGGAAAEGDDAPAALPAATGQFTVMVESDTPVQPEDDDAEPPLDTGEYFKVTVTRGGETLETFEHLTMKEEVAEAEGSYVITALADSEYLDVELAEGLPAVSALSKRPANGTYQVSPPAPYIDDVEKLPRELQGNRSDRKGVQGIFEIDDVSIIACPDLMLLYQRDLIDLDQLHGIMEMMLSMCENSAPSPPYRMAVIDPPPVKPGKNENKAVPPEQQKPQDVATWLSMFNRRSMFGALYYPWIKVANPRNGGRPIFIPPCGHMMGVWCRTDETRGLFKAPANDTPRGVIGLAYETNFREQELLNPLGINCIRNFANFNRGIKIWGARTLVEPDNIQWRYIPVRRLMSYIEKSIEIGTQWVVFEPNDEALWGRVTQTVSSFLEGLWREGALVGANVGESFFVKCDGEINTPDTMMKGRLYVEVGVAPVRPAEFVIFRISQWAPGQ